MVTITLHSSAEAYLKPFLMTNSLCTIPSPAQATCESDTGGKNLVALRALGMCLDHQDSGDYLA